MKATLFRERKCPSTLSTGEEKKINTIDLVVIRKVSSQRPLLVLIGKEYSKQDSKATHDPAPSVHTLVLPLLWKVGGTHNLSTLQNTAKGRGYHLQDYVMWPR